MSNDSETEIDPAAILATIEGEDAPDAFVDALTTLESDVEEVLALDEEAGRTVETLLAQLEGRKSEFLERVLSLDDRYAPYIDEMATRMKYDASDDAAERWPFALAEEEVSSDE